jgi:hypothetical protein
MIVLLLRLYPARWRARYGDEFAAVLEERPLGPFDVADVLLGALDAHPHLRGLGAASQHAKGFAMSLRIGGYAAILGGILWLLALAGNAINNGGESPSPLLFVALIGATIATLVALVGGIDGWIIMSFGLLTLLLGSGLFAIATWRARSLSRWAAALLGFGAFLVVPSIAGATGGIVPEVLAIPFLVATIVAFPAGWMGLGISALRVGPATNTTFEGASL